MAESRQSLQDIIRDRQRREFIGRRNEISQYWDNFALRSDNPHRRFLFNIHGDAGVGKTYLVKKLQQMAREAGALTVYIDETADDLATAISLAASQFSRAGVSLRELEKRVAAYRERRHDLESDPNAPDGLATFLTTTAVTIGFHAMRDVPIAGSLLAPVDVAATAEQANNARAYIARKIKDRADMRLLLSPADELSPIFVAGLGRFARNRPVALFFDTYERTGKFLEPWLLDLYSGRYGDLPSSLVVTISGQIPLNPNIWSDYLSVIVDVPLEPFSDMEARQFLTGKGITEELAVDAIISLSGRLPLWLVTLAYSRLDLAAEIGDPAGDVVERFLKWEDNPARRAVALVAALPRFLNQDVLAVLTPSGEGSFLFPWLCRLPFIDQQAGCWKYHDVVRQAMIREQRTRSPADWRANHLMLARAYSRWALEATGDSDRNWISSECLSYTREKIYHLLCADPADNLVMALATAVSAAASSSTAARQWARIFADAGRDADQPALRLWGQRLSESIEDNDLTRYLTYLIDDASLDNASLASAFLERGKSHQLAGRYDNGLTDFNRAVELDPNRKLAITRRGQIYLAEGQYDKALADFTRALDLEPGYAGAMAARGLAHLALEQYDKAVADLTRAIDLDPGMAWAIASRGQAHLGQGRYDKAVADLTRAIDLDPDLATAIASRGQAWLLSVPTLTVQQVRDSGGDPDRGDLIRLTTADDVILLPAFQFDQDGQPIPVVTAINRLLKVGEDPWGVADWWLGANTWLEGVPAYLLGHIDDTLLTLAAETESPER